MPDVAPWLEELSSWVYVVLIGGWLIQRWARKMANPQSKQGSLDGLHARWPSFRRVELEGFIAAHGGNVESAGATIQQEVLCGKRPGLIHLEITKEDASNRLGCVLAGSPTHLPSVSGVTPGSLAAASLRVGDVLCRVNGEPALGVQEAQRLLVAASGVVRLQVHRCQGAAELDRELVRANASAVSGDAAITGASAGEKIIGATLRQRTTPPRLGGYAQVMVHPPEWQEAA